MEHDLREGLRGRAYKEVGKSGDNKEERISLREGKLLRGGDFIKFKQLWPMFEHFYYFISRSKSGTSSVTETLYLYIKQCKK